MATSAHSTVSDTTIKPLRANSFVFVSRDSLARSNDRHMASQRQAHEQAPDRIWIADSRPVCDLLALAPGGWRGDPQRDTLSARCALAGADSEPWVAPVLYLGHSVVHGYSPFPGM